MLSIIKYIAILILILHCNLRAEDSPLAPFPSPAQRAIDDMNKSIDVLTVQYDKSVHEVRDKAIKQLNSALKEIMAKGRSGQRCTGPWEDSIELDKANAVVKAPKTGPPPTTSVAVGNHYYQFYHENLQYKDALKRCVDLGGHLAVIRNEQEMSEIVGMLHLGHEYNRSWIGMTYSKSDDAVSWCNKEPVVYTKWGSGGTPLDTDGAKLDQNGVGFVEYSPTHGNMGKWFIVNPSFSLIMSRGDDAGFICEWDP